MTNTFEAQVHGVLEPITSSMEADGYHVQVSGEEGGLLRVIITADESACADCLAPKKVIGPMITTLLTDHGLSAGDLELVYPTEGR